MERKQQVEMAVLLGEVANLVKPVHSVTVETVDITQLHPAVAVAMVYIVIGPSLLAYWFWGSAVRQAGPATAAIFTNLTPPFEPICERDRLHRVVAYWRELAGIKFIIVSDSAESVKSSIAELIEAGVIGSGRDGLGGVVGEDEDADLLAGTVRERRGAAHVLVARGAVHAEAEGKLDRLVEFGFREFGEDVDRFLERIILREISDLEGAAVAFAVGFWHGDSLRCERR